MGRTPEEIRAEIQDVREQFVEGIKGLSSVAHPSIIKEETIQRVKDAAADQIKTVKNYVVDETGVRWDRIGNAALVGLGLLLIRGLLRGIWRWLKD